jgi:hypothetical protein
MSNDAISWAYHQAEVSDPISAFILVTLADQADDFGVLWVRQSTLVEKCRCSKRKVQYCLQSLEQSGLILQFRRRRDNGSQMSSAFLMIGWKDRKRPTSVEEHPTLKQLHVEGILTDDTIKVHHVHSDAGRTTCTSRVHHVQEGGAPRAPLEPSIEPSEEPYKETQTLFSEVEDQKSAQVDDGCPRGFEAFWEAYPPGRKTAKPQALAAWHRIVTGRAKGIPKTDPETIISAARRYAASRPDPQYVPMPATWLNGARWDQWQADQPDPDRDRYAAIRDRAATFQPHP